MDLNDFIEHFAEQFDETEKIVFTAETVFKELDEWSSLIALSVMAMADEEYKESRLCIYFRLSTANAVDIGILLNKKIMKKIIVVSVPLMQ